MGVQLFKRRLTDGFAASRALLIANETVTLDWAITVDDDVFVEWYMEFSETGSDTATDWFQEVTQEVTGSGAVAHHIAIRTFFPEGSTGPLTAVGSPYRLQTEFVRRAKFARVQVRRADPAGDASVTITAPFGMLAIAAT